MFVINSIIIMIFPIYKPELTTWYLQVLNEVAYVKLI